MSDVAIGLDLSTGGVRAIAVDLQGQLIAQATASYPLRSQEPQAYTQVRLVLLPKDYLGYVLTGEAVTEPSDASGVGCLHLADRRWDLDILTAL